MTEQNVQSKFNPTTRPTAVIGAGTLGMRSALMFASSGGEARHQRRTSCPAPGSYIGPLTGSTHC
jgi:hypothetical protein